jgi:hypothetical protein
LWMSESVLNDTVTIVASFPAARRSPEGAHTTAGAVLTKSLRRWALS